MSIALTPAEQATTRDSNTDGLKHFWCREHCTHAGAPALCGKKRKRTVPGNAVNTCVAATDPGMCVVCWEIYQSKIGQLFPVGFCGWCEVWA